jgi:hypothetical protein
MKAKKSRKGCDLEWWMEMYQSGFFFILSKSNKYLSNKRSLV